MKTRTAADWQARLRDAGVPHAPVLDYPQLFGLEQVAARGMKVTVRDPHGQPVDLAGSPFHLDGADLPGPRMPPRLGEHTEEVLRDVLGLDAARLGELRSTRVI
jgi:crotonobetainyl-CoA:carnitine CoA-transferase CaiB-like acyl-CoA transferase